MGNVAAVGDGEVIQPAGRVDASEAAELVRAVLPEIAEQARGGGGVRRRAPETTRFCPLGHRCESCGAESPGLAVVTCAVLSEVICLTMCPACAASGRPPAIMLSTAERLAAAHRRHLAGYQTPGRGASM
jgi:hypothetical protein